MQKKLLFGIGSGLFIVVSLIGISWIAKQEIEKGRAENMEISNLPDDRTNGSGSQAEEDPVAEVTSKAEAETALHDMDGLVGELEKDDETLSQ